MASDGRLRAITQYRRGPGRHARLERRRESLVEQFVKLESLLGRLQSQGSWLMSQVDALNGSRSN